MSSVHDYASGAEEAVEDVNNWRIRVPHMHNMLLEES